MAINSAPFIPADGTILVNDGAALAYTISYEEGDFSISGMAQDDLSTEIFRDRGDIISVRQIQEEPITLSFSAIATEISDGTDLNFLDAFLKLGGFASATSVLAAAGDVWAVKVTLTLDSSTAGGSGEADQTIIINHFIPQDVSFSEGIPGKFSVSGIGIPFGGVAAYTLA